MNFYDYYKNMGFEKYPFGVFTSEAEKDVIKEIYLPPPNHTVILEGLKNTSAIITGERGSGKTALSLNIGDELDKPSNLTVRIEEFSSLKEDYQTEDLYRFLIERIVVEFFSLQIVNPTKLWKFSKEDRLDLSMFLHTYLGATTKALLRDKINKLQNGLLKRFCTGTYNFFRHPLNYTLKAFTKVANDILASHFPSLPPVEASDSEYFKKIESEIDSSFTQEQKEYFYLEKICNLIKKANIDKIYIIIDKVDEDPRFENDAENIASYLEKLASDNKILTNALFHILLFTWSTPFNYVKDNVRTQKLAFYQLSWDGKQLQDVLDRRLSAYSSGKTSNTSNILDPSTNLDVVFDMCNKNPRDLWHILNKAFEEQFKLDPSQKITDQAISAAIERFVTEFNYFEYYPKKSNARSNTMDVYKFIKHLSKLDDYRFTKDKLNQTAGTGGSTNNYVVAMENMGLIRNTNEKGHGGGVIYEIVDPKVKYAMAHGLSIGS